MTGEPTPEEREFMARLTGPAVVEHLAEIRASCRAVRELYVGLLLEGFDDRQALAIVGQVIAANGPGS